MRLFVCVSEFKSIANSAVESRHAHCRHRLSEYRHHDCYYTEASGWRRTAFAVDECDAAIGLSEESRRVLDAECQAEWYVLMRMRH